MFSIARTDFLSFILGFLNNIRDEYVILITIFFSDFIVLLLPPVGAESSRAKLVFTKHYAKCAVLRMVCSPKSQLFCFLVSQMLFY